MEKLIRYKDKRLRIVRILHKDYVEDNIEEWKKYLNSDFVLKKANEYFFCIEIQDIKPISESIWDDKKKSWIELKH